MMKSQADYLPNSWTTLYEISRLAESELTKYISEGVIHQNVLGSVIKSLNGSTKNDETSTKEAGVDGERQEEVPNGTVNGLTFNQRQTPRSNQEVQSTVVHYFPEP